MYSQTLTMNSEILKRLNILLVVVNKVSELEPLTSSNRNDRVLFKNVQ